MKILKFGGGVLTDDKSIKKIPEILSKYTNQKIVIVVSSFGKTTNLLEKYLNTVYDKIEYRKKYSIFSSLAFRELMFIAWKLKLITEEDNSFFYIIKKLINNTEPLFQNYKLDYDQIVSLGELISSKIISYFLLKQGIDNSWVDIRSFLITDSHFRNASVNWDQTKENFHKGFPSKNIIITQGFIGSDNKMTTTLGREGSDYSAAIIGNLLNAFEVILFKDVDGVYEKDPKIEQSKSQHPIARISYDDIKKYSNPNQPIVHPKTIMPLKEKNIILKIQKFGILESMGTIIN